VVGLRLAAAKAKIVEAACKTGRITRKYSRARPKGRVLAQRPSADFVVDPGTKVNLTVSKGKRPKKKHHRGR
jgi:serine/threonine-protein kinase